MSATDETATFSFPCKAKVISKQGAELKCVDRRCVVKYSHARIFVSGFIRTVESQSSNIARVLDSFINDGRMSLQFKDGQVVSFSDAAAAQLKHLVTVLTGKRYGPTSPNPVSNTKENVATVLQSNRAGNWAKPKQTSKSGKVSERRPLLLSLPETVVYEVLEFLTSDERKVVSTLHTSLWSVVKMARTHLVVRTKDFPVTNEFVIKSFRSHERLSCFGLPEFPLTNDEVARWILMPPKYFQRIKTLCLRGCKLLHEGTLKSLVRVFSSLKFLDISDIPVVTTDVLRFLPDSLDHLVLGVRDNKRLKSKIGNLLWVKPALKALTMTGCDLVTNIDDKISKPSELMHLDLSGSSLVSLSGLPASLRSFKLDSVKCLSAVELSTKVAKLSLLELLDLSGSEIDDAGLMHIVNSCRKLRRLKLAACPFISDIGVRFVFENVVSLETFDLSSNWKVSHHFWEALSIKGKQTLSAIGIANTNLAPVFCDPLSEFVYSQTGATSVVSGRVNVEAVDYVGKRVTGELDQLIKLRVL